MSIRITYLKENNYIRSDGSIKFTKVTMFCLPMIGLKYKEFEDHLLNVYSNHEESPHLYVVIKNPQNENKTLTIIINKLRSNHSLVEEYLDDDGYELVFKLKLDNKYEDDYYKILSGDYSKISEEYKKVLVDIYSSNVHDLSKPPTISDGQVLTTMYEVLYPTIEKKKVIAKHFGVEVSSIKELISKPDIRYELYKKTNELNNEEEIYEKG